MPTTAGVPTGWLPRRSTRCSLPPLPDRCECGGEIELDRIAHKYQEGLPKLRPIRRRFDVGVGHCRSCGCRHQGRHPCQTSDALGVAASMLGPRAVALSTQLNKELGLSPKKISQLLAEQFGISITPGRRRRCDRAASARAGADLPSVDRGRARFGGGRPR